MNLTELSDADLAALATTEVDCDADDHDESGCLACQAFAIWESRDPIRRIA